MYSSFPFVGLYIVSGNVQPVVRLTTSHRKTLLLRNLYRGGQGSIWAVAPVNGWNVEPTHVFVFRSFLALTTRLGLEIPSSKPFCLSFLGR
jgi:hypothetical protein